MDLLQQRVEDLLEAKEEEDDCGFSRGSRKKKTTVDSAELQGRRKTTVDSAHLPKQRQD